MLDTRNKIVAAGRDATEFSGGLMIAAYLDPMVHTHAARLRELAAEHGLLTICLCDPPDPLLPAAARAELAAACRDVAHVVVGEEALASAGRVIDIRPGDLNRRADLMRHVYSRQDG